jgi:hypothetical protein
MVYDHDLADMASYKNCYVQFKICLPAPILAFNLNPTFIQIIKFKA